MPFARQSRPMRGLHFSVRPAGFHDVRHRVVTSVLYDLPVGKGEMLNVGSSFLNQIVVGGNPAEFQFGNVGRNTIRCPTSIILPGAAQAECREPKLIRFRCVRN